MIQGQRPNMYFLLCLAHQPLSFHRSALSIRSRRTHSSSCSEHQRQRHKHPLYCKNSPFLNTLQGRLSPIYSSHGKHVVHQEANHLPKMSTCWPYWPVKMSLFPSVLLGMGSSTSVRQLPLKDSSTKTPCEFWRSKRLLLIEECVRVPPLTYSWFFQKMEWADLVMWEYFIALGVSRLPTSP